ncbi:hypothetical protein KHP62_12165 [Rhodobacteraceae bacterium NNCM2]|nr:hypothetical protein [Coraliihabitans acroporae]
MSGHYRGFGLTIRSDLPLDGFAPAEAGPPDVEIMLGDQARAAVEATGVAPMDMAVPPGGGWCLRVPEVCDYLMRRGAEIHLSPAPGAEVGHVALYLIGSAMGMILHQRGLHPLHAATIAVEGTAIAFVGDQGAGKSTLAVTMAAAGHAVLGDDVIVVREEAGGFSVAPGATQFKLWRETVEALGLAPGPSVANRLEKFYVANEGAKGAAPCPLGAIVELRRGPAESGFAPARAAQFEALDLVARHTYRPAYVGLLDRQEAHFRQCAALIGNVPVWRLSRPGGLDRLEDTRRWLEANWSVLCANPPKRGD